MKPKQNPRSATAMLTGTLKNVELVSSVHQVLVLLNAFGADNDQILWGPVNGNMSHEHANNDPVSLVCS
jgi:hypothetical protein